MKNKNAIIFLVVILIILLIGGVYYFSSGKIGKNIKSDVVLMLEPTAKIVKVGDTFTVNVNINTNIEIVSAAELHIEYQADTLQGISMVKGSFLPVELSKASIKSGMASIILGSEPTNPMKGDGTLATLTFKAVSAGLTQILFASTTQVAAIGKKINVVSEMTPVTITVNP